MSIGFALFNGCGLWLGHVVSEDLRHGWRLDRLAMVLAFVVLVSVVAHLLRSDGRRHERADAADLPRGCARRRKGAP